MVKAIIDIEDHTNRVLNILKAKFGLKDKSEAIDLMAKQYEEMILGPELRPEHKHNPRGKHLPTHKTYKKQLLHCL